MKPPYLWTVAILAIALGAVIHGAQGPAPAAGARGQGGGGGRGAGPPANAAAITAATPNPANGALIGGSILPDKPEAGSSRLNQIAIPACVLFGASIL